MPKPKYTVNDVRRVVEDNNGKLLSSEYRVQSDKIDILCNACRKQFHPAFYDVVRGGWCPTCAQSKYSIQDVEQIIINKDGTLLDEIKYHGDDNIHIKCNKCDNEWTTRWNYLIGGRWCEKCAGCKKYTIEEVIDILENKNITLLSDKYDGNCQYLEVKCKICNYEWDAQISKLKKYTGCPSCARNIKYSIEYVKEYISGRGGLLLSKEYNGANNEISIQCLECDNMWPVTFASIKNRGSWCSGCCNGKTQKILYLIIKEIFSNVAVFNNFCNFDWLKTYGGGKQELDIYIPELKLAIEYDGEQHFKPVRFGGISTKEANIVFKRTRQLDKLKNRKIKEHGEDIKYFVRFNYKEKNKLCKEYVIEKLIKEGVKI